MMKLVRFAMAVLACSVLTTAAVAQERQDNNRDRDRSDQASASQRADKQIAYCLLIDNWTEVEVAKAAVQQLQQPEVKQFAEQMIADHARAMEQLQAVAGKPRDRATDTPGRTERRGPDSNDEAASNSNDNDELAAVNAPASDDEVADDESNANGNDADRSRADRTRRQHAQMSKGLPFLQVKQQMAEQCLQTAKRELDSKQPDEIDRCFMTHQVFGHTAMLDALTVLQNYASPELRPIIEEATQTTRQHLEQAKQLLKTVEAERTAPSTTGASG